MDDGLVNNDVAAKERQMQRGPFQGMYIETLRGVLEKETAEGAFSSRLLSQRLELGLTLTLATQW